MKQVNPFKQVLALFSTLRFFYDKLPDKSGVDCSEIPLPLLEKLKHFHGIGSHFYYVADLRMLKIVELGGSFQSMTGMKVEKILGRNFSVALKIFSLEELPNILKSMIQYHEYIYKRPVEQRMFIKGSIILKVRNGKGGYFTGLLQAAPLVLDSKGHIAVMFSSITDISHFNIESDYVKVDIIDESDPEEIKVINIINKKNNILFELSKSEIRVLNLLKDGKSTKEIADKLFLSEHTVNTHRRNMIQKINVKNTAELVSRTRHLV